VTTLVVLPSLDGTATMHAAFVAAVHDYFDAISVLAYPTDVELDYAQLEQRVRAQLPGTPFILLGESFSGPIALAIARDPPPHLLALVLSTSFSRAPLPLSGLLAGLVRCAPVRAVPVRVWSWLLLGRWSTPTLRSMLGRALATVEPGVLRSRAADALRADVQGIATIGVPVLYLRATHDRLLAQSAGRRIVEALPHADVAEVAGPHLLLQAAPQEAARVIGGFAGSLQK
jgi:pimeloyl-[acyl-carrier protein] methyl ester esterase